MVRSYIRGIGSYVPPKVVTNEELSILMDTTDEWIRTRTGIEERRVAEEGVYCTDLAKEAAVKAVEDAGLEMSDIEFIIFATLSPDHHFPGSACYLQPKLGLEGIGCLDVRNQCTGFLYSLATADAFVKTGLYTNILVVGAEVHSSALNYTNEGRDVAVLFGDGAAAAVVSPTEDENRGIMYHSLHADGRHAKALCLDIWDISRKPYLDEEIVNSPMRWPAMNGRVVFKNAVVRLCETIFNVLFKHNINAQDIKWFIPHQANMRINHMVAEQLGLPKEKFLHNMQRYGNTTAASIPLLLDETYRAGDIEPGDLLMLLGFGAGFTWGVTIMRW
ncbi:MAG: 3-oxoacyl-ACP synthase III family protein [Desulfatibacillaceae bacterium]